MEVFPAHLYRKFVKIIKSITIFGFPILGPILGPIVGPILGPARLRLDLDYGDGDDYIVVDGVQAHIQPTLLNRAAHSG